MNWYHSPDHIELNSPSRADGVDFETEARYRKEGARFIMELGNKLGLPYLPIATGWVFFHRFYMFHSFKEFPRWVTGATCLLLSGKVEETPKKCKNILKYAQQVLDDNKFKTFGENPREELMVCERVLLQTIKFDLQLNHPYQYLIKYGKLLKGDKGKINELVQKAWTLINESFLSTTLCLVYKPQVVALAVLLLAIKDTNQMIQDFISSRKHHEWWKLFYSETSEAELEEVCKELTLMVIEGKPPKRLHVEKKKGNDSVTNSPQPTGSPKLKKQKVALQVVAAPVASALEVNSIDHSKPIVNGIVKEEEAELLASENKKLSSLETPTRMRRMSSKETSHKQGSQTPEEMDVEKASPDLVAVDGPESRLSKDHGLHHEKTKDHHHQPVTLQQVQAQQHKQLQKQAQKNRLLLHRKHLTPNKHASNSSLQKMPTLTPIKQQGLQKDLIVSQQDIPPELKSIATITSIRKQLDALSQKAEEIASQQNALAALKPTSPTRHHKKAHAHTSTKSQSQVTKSTQEQLQQQKQKQKILHKQQQKQQEQLQETQQLHQEQQQQKQPQVPQKTTQPQQQPPKKELHQLQQEQVQEEEENSKQQPPPPQLTEQEENRLLKQHPQLSQTHTNSQDSPKQPVHQQSKNVQQQAMNAATNSPAGQQTVDQSTHSSTPPNLTDGAQGAAPLLDHMSSFFQSSQTYNYPSQNYNYQQTTFPPAPPFPQPTLPQGLPQPPQGYTQSNYMTSGQHYPDTSAQTFSTYSSTQPQLLLPPPPTMFHGTPWL